MASFMIDEQVEPKKSRKWLKITGITLITLVVLAGIGYGSYYIINRNRNIVPATDFTLTTLTGSNFTLSDNIGSVVLLDFMSYTCGPCWLMMPDLVELYEEYNDTVVFFSIHVGTYNQTELEERIDEYNATWDFAFDTEDLITKYAASPIPKTVIIDKDGYVTYSHNGLTTKETIQNELEEALAGTADPINVGYRFIMVAAFFSGILSFFSPCAFPLLPGYMAYNLELLVRAEKKKDGTEEESEEEEKDKRDTKIDVRKRVWKSFLWGSAAAFGLLLFYMIIGIISAFVGEVVSEWVEYITPAIGVILIILGIITFTPLQLNLSKAVDAISKIGTRRRKKKDAIDSDEDTEDEETSTKKQGTIRREMPQMFQLFIYGITYALASLGCNLPILLGLIVGSIEAGAFGKAILIFLVYSLAMAVLMIIITMLVGFSKDVLINKLRASTRFVKILSGILLILAGGFLIGWFLWNWYNPN
ncbi:MAG: redoxin domain-containing protein [Asgard group archaeon]|nr:redoxin domain-containing protein [Asgard group archaeon]